MSFNKLSQQVALMIIFLVTLDLETRSDELDLFGVTASVLAVSVWCIVDARRWFTCLKVNVEHVIYSGHNVVVSGGVEPDLGRGVDASVVYGKSTEALSK